MMRTLADDENDPVNKNNKYPDFRAKLSHFKNMNHYFPIQEIGGRKCYEKSTKAPFGTSEKYQKLFKAIRKTSEMDLVRPGTV